MWCTVNILTYLCSQAGFKVWFHVGHRNSVLGSFGTAAARNHCVQIQLYNLTDLYLCSVSWTNLLLKRDTQVCDCIVIIRKFSFMCSRIENIKCRDPPEWTLDPERHHRSLWTWTLPSGTFECRPPFLLLALNMNKQTTKIIYLDKSVQISSLLGAGVKHLKTLPLTSLLEVLNTDVVHGEESRCGSVLWTHVGDSGTIGDGQLSNTGAEKLHKLPHDTHLTEVLRAQGGKGQSQKC